MSADLGPPQTPAVEPPAAGDRAATLDDASSDSGPIIARAPRKRIHVIRGSRSLCNLPPPPPSPVVQSPGAGAVAPPAKAPPPIPSAPRPGTAPPAVPTAAKPALPGATGASPVLSRPPPQVPSVRPPSRLPPPLPSTGPPGSHPALPATSSPPGASAPPASPAGGSPVSPPVAAPLTPPPARPDLAGSAGSSVASADAAGAAASASPPASPSTSPPSTPVRRPSVPSAPKPGGARVAPPSRLPPPVPQTASAPAFQRTGSGGFLVARTPPPARLPPRVPTAPRPSLPVDAAPAGGGGAEPLAQAAAAPTAAAASVPAPITVPPRAAPQLTASPGGPPMPGSITTMQTSPTLPLPSMTGPPLATIPPPSGPPPVAGAPPAAPPAAPVAAPAPSSEASSVSEEDSFSDSGRLSSSALSDYGDDRIASSASRDLWESNVVMRHPEILELRERVHPIDRVLMFGKLYGAGRMDVKVGLSRDIVAQLVMQHLHCAGLRATRQKLEDESKIKYKGYANLKGSRLRAIVRRALAEGEGVFDATIGDKDMYQRDGAEQELLDRVSILVQEEESAGRDCNIWEEPPDNKSNIALAEGTEDAELAQIKAATLNKLVERLTSEKSHDLKYMKTFLMTYQSFTTPEKLLQKLIQRYQVPPPRVADSDNPEKAEEDWKRSVQRPIQLRVCNVLKNWVEKHFRDFKDAVMTQLTDFIDNTLTRDGHLGLAKQLRNTIAKQQSGKVDRREIMFTEAPPEPKVPKNIFSRSLTIMDCDEEEIARQLTCVEFDIYAAIQPSELLKQAWSKPKYHHLAPNVRGMAARFNLFSGWVATCILKVESLRARARVMAKFIHIAEHLRALNNFNSLMSVLAGFNNSAVHRLKHTKVECGKILQDSLAEMETQMSSTASYKKYREILHNVDPPCIPYLGVYLTDLTFVEDGNPDFLNSLINFAKRKLVYNVIVEIQQYQQRPYNLQPVHQIQRLLLAISALPENDLFRLSNAREPRGADRSELTL